MNNIQELKRLLEMQNPEAIAEKMANGNPLLQNIIKLAKSGDTKSIETFARNYYQSQGLNFDQEFQKFMNNIR